MTEIYKVRNKISDSVLHCNMGRLPKNMQNIYSDSAKFQEFEVEKNKLLIELEDILKSINSIKYKDNFTESFHNDCYTWGSQLESLYGLPKVIKNNCPMCPVVAAYGLFNINLGKQLVPLISQSGINLCILKNHTILPNIIRTLSNANNSVMCSLEISSLFTNITAAETINLRVNNVYANSLSINKSIRSKHFQKLLQLVLNITYLKLNGKIYK